MTIHDLKIWPKHFEDVVAGRKRAEVRVNDRGFQEEDILFLREWVPTEEGYTGRHVYAQITHVGSFPDGRYVVLSIRLLNQRAGFGQ